MKVPVIWCGNWWGRGADIHPPPRATCGAGDDSPDRFTGRNLRGLDWFHPLCLCHKDAHTAGSRGGRIPRRTSGRRIKTFNNQGTQVHPLSLSLQSLIQGKCKSLWILYAYIGNGIKALTPHEAIVVPDFWDISFLYFSSPISFFPHLAPGMGLFQMIKSFEC